MKRKFMWLVTVGVIGFAVIANSTETIMTHCAFVAPLVTSLASISPTGGEIVLDDTTDKFWGYDGAAWVDFTGSAAKILAVSSKTANYTATEEDDYIVYNTASGPYTLTLYDASGNAGRMIRVKKSNSNAVYLKIQGNQSGTPDTIDGQSAIYLGAQNETVTLVCDGTNWNILSQTIPGGGTVYFKDVKTSGTDGGSITEGSWQQRTLNTSEGDTTFSSLSSNQFTLQPGTYVITASAASFNVGEHRIRVYNVTDSSVAISGVNAGVSLPASGASSAQLEGTITITAAKAFKLEHRVERSSTQFGRGSASGWADEVFATVKVTKIR